METLRQQKMGRLIQKELSDIFLKHGREWFGPTLISVTIVRMSPDLSQARAYLSILLHQDPQGLVNSISAMTKDIRKSLSPRIRHQVRIIPELSFYLDDSAAYADQMNTLFKSLDIPPAEPKEAPEEE